MKSTVIASDGDVIQYIEKLRENGKITSITAYRKRWIVNVNYCGNPSASAEAETLHEAFALAYNAYLFAGGAA